MSVAKKEGKANGPDNRVLYALALSFLFHALHVVALPLVVSYDGHLYYKLAMLPGSGKFWAEFDYLRTPIYPLLLRGAFLLCGERPDSVLMVNAAFSFIGIAALGIVMRALAGSLAAVVGIAMLTVWPLSVTYQHLFLSEAASAAMFALIALALFFFVRNPRWKTCAWLTTVLVAAYYLRPTYLYLAPVCSFFVPFLRYAKRGTHHRPAFRFLCASAVILTAVPMIASAPWRALGEKSGRMGDIFVYGMLNQGLLLPENSEDLGPAQESYIKAFEHAQNGGHLDFSGLTEADVIKIQFALPAHVRNGGGAFFLKAVMAAPFRYAKGVVRTLMLFFGARALESENDIFSMLALNVGPHPVILEGPPEMRPLIAEKFFKPMMSSGLQQFEERLSVSTSSRSWVLCANILGVLLLFAAVIRRNLSLAVLPYLVLAFYGLHAATLLSLDRYAFPAYFLLIAASTVFLARALRWMTMPVVVERAHPSKESDRPLWSLLEMKAMEEAVKDRGNDNASGRDKRQTAV